MDIRTYLRSRLAGEPAMGIGWAFREGRPMSGRLRPWSSAERRLMRLIERELGARWSRCYSTAQRAALLATELGMGSHRLAYCEGFACLPDLPAPFAHAWCLLNDQVWDPARQFIARRADYFGTEIPLSVARRAIASRRAWGPVMLSPLLPAAPRYLLAASSGS